MKQFQFNLTKLAKIKSNNYKILIRLINVKYEVYITKNQTIKINHFIMITQKNLTFKSSIKNVQESFISSMEKQQIAFRSFLNSLNKCSNKQPIVYQNPQEKYYPIQSTIKLLQTPNKNKNSKSNLPEQSNVKSMNKIKKSQQIPQSSFRISVMKSIQKQRPSNRSEQVKQSLIKASRRKISEVKQISSRNYQVKQKTKQINNLSNRYFPNAKNQINLQQAKQSQVKQLQIKVKQSKISELKEQKNKKFSLSKLRLHQAQTVSWNPQSHSFFTNLINKNNQKLSQTSSFLLQLLNMQVTNTIKFLKQQNDIIQNMNQIQGKQIFDLFKQIFDINKFSQIKQPLIKKYNNCIFYGEKPNFESIHSGIIVYFNGNAYFGSLKNFQKHGFGIQLVQSSNISDKFYKPQINNKKNTSNYVIFRGNFFKNSKSGQFLISAKDYIYQGMLAKGFFQGQGILIQSQSIFKGIWMLNKKVKGTESFKNAQITYEGEFVQDKFHGKGKLKKSDQFYQGQFKNGMKNGKGILVNQSFIFQGIFQNDKKHGSGIFFDKIQYSQLNPEFKNKQADFQECIYKVKFDEDQLLNKSDFRQTQIVKVQSLKTLEEDKSVSDTFTIDIQNVSPSKFLNCVIKDKFPQNKRIINTSTIVESNKFNQILSVYPSQPEQQKLYAQKQNTYLLGNKTCRSPKRIHKDLN